MENNPQIMEKIPKLWKIIPKLWKISPKFRRKKIQNYGEKNPKLWREKFPN